MSLLFVLLFAQSRGSIKLALLPPKASWKSSCLFTNFVYHFLKKVNKQLLGYNSFQRFSFNLSIFEEWDKKTKLCHTYYYNEIPFPTIDYVEYQKPINLCPSPTTTPILVVIFSFFSTLTILFLLNALLEIHTPRRWCPSPRFQFCRLLPCPPRPQNDIRRKTKKSCSLLSHNN